MTNKKTVELSNERSRIRKQHFNDKMSKERLRFEAEQGYFKKPRIAYGAWINALTNDRYTWQLTITFPYKLPKDDKMKRFKEEIMLAFEKIYFQP